MNLQDIVEQARTLFVLPDSVIRLKACMDDEASSIDDIADIISFDPSLATQVLRVANSALYQFPNKIDTISKAVKVVGTRATYDLALAYAVSNVFSEIDGKVIDLDKFWEQSVSCALLAKYFAEQRNEREPERLFVAGLLHNIGELILVALAPDKARRIQDYNARVSPAELQLGVLGFTVNTLSAAIIKQWGIPASIYRPIMAIHNTDDQFVGLQSDSVDNNILQLSYVLALDNINADIYPSYNHLKPHLHEHLKLERDDLENALDITNLQCISVISIFNPNAFMPY